MCGDVPACERGASLCNWNSLSKRHSQAAPNRRDQLELVCNSLAVRHIQLLRHRPQFVDVHVQQLHFLARSDECTSAAATSVARFASATSIDAPSSKKTESLLRTGVVAGCGTC